MPGAMTLEERKARVIMEVRGYREEESITIEEPKELKDCKLIKARDRKGELALFLCIPKSTNVRTKHITAFAGLLSAEGAKRGIVIARGRYVKDARLKAKRIKEAKVELIPKEFPSFNIFKHELVPEHRVLSPEEAEETLKRFRVKPYQLPWILASDPAVIAIGAEPGDIVEIRRKSETAGEAIFYRYVVE